MPSSKRFLQQFCAWTANSYVCCQALTPQLDEYGQQGWELVSIQPVIVGEDGDILIE